MNKEFIMIFEEKDNECCYYCEKDFSKNKLINVATFDGWKKCCNACRDNIFYCCSCKKYYDLNDFVYEDLNNKKSICHSCFDADYFLCRICNKTKKKKYMAGDLYCEECKEQGDNKYKNKTIYSYSYKPVPHFFKMPKEKTDLFIGIELEIAPNLHITSYKNSNYDFIQSIKELTNFVYCKDDSSLPYGGVEIVSHPATINYHNNSNEWKHIFELIKDNNMNNTNGCGLHFHLSRKFFTDESIRVFDYFVNNNEKLMESIGGRPLDDYCEAITKNINNWGQKICSSHCDAINLTPKNTIEIRFCKSTDDIDVFLMRLNTIFQMAMFVKSRSFKDIITKDNKRMFKNFIRNFR